jgi:polyhydroxyalkanoate synthesis regulator phasin
MAVPARVSTDPHTPMSEPSNTPRPYAGPTAASAAALELARGLLDATASGPYVPAAWRRADAAPARVAELTPSTPMAAVEAVRGQGDGDLAEPFVTEPAMSDAQTTASDDLPWIDSFLASTPPLPMMAIEDASSPVLVDDVVDDVVDEVVDEVADEAVDEVADDVIVEAYAQHVHFEEPVAPAAASHVSHATTDDTWPLDEATPDFERLSQQIDASHGPEVVATPAQAAHAVPMNESEPATPALAPWSDEEFMDIMPVRRAMRTPMSSAAVDQSSQWAERARAAQVARDAAQDAGVGRASEAAEALEMLARRVRNGELAVPDFDGRNGESAALVAALAAVLGVRLR